MTLKIGTLMLLAGASFAAVAQSPTAVESIYSEVGSGQVGDTTVTYEFANWYAAGENGDLAIWPAIFDAVAGAPSLVEGVTVDANGVAIAWNAADKLISVKCDEGNLGRTNVLITDYNGVNRDVVAINENPATISLSDYVPGTYIVAVAVDGQLIKTLKLILK